MFPGFLITFREVLEIALVLSIIVGFLKQSRQERLIRQVWQGLFAGVGASLLGAVIFVSVTGGFEGRTEEIFEGIMMLIGAGLLTTMILWMLHKEQAQNLRRRLDTSFAGWGIFSLVFVAVLREGIELVIFLRAAMLVDADALFGAMFGFVGAVTIGILLFISTRRLPLRMFFTVTNVLLILFAAGLIAHGVHELQEAQVLPTFVEHLWDSNPSIEEGGAYPALHEKGAIGSLFAGLFGYNGDPSLLEVLVYVTYLGMIGFWWHRSKRKKAAY